LVFGAVIEPIFRRAAIAGGHGAIDNARVGVAGAAFVDTSADITVA
jgi:hypothetical protein